MTKDDQKKVCKWVDTKVIFDAHRDGWQNVLDDDGVIITKIVGTGLCIYMVRDE